MAQTMPRGALVAAPFDFELEPAEDVLDDPDGLLVPLLVVALVEDETLLDGGAAVARAPTLLHCAAALAPVSLPLLNGRYETPPLLSS